MRHTRKESVSKPLPSVRIGISRCLLGDPVRYDGGHKREVFSRTRWGVSSTGCRYALKWKRG